MKQVFVNTYSKTTTDDKASLSGALSSEAAKSSSLLDDSAQRPIELLAPAGGWEQLRYALYFGADAVYLACDKFGLRSRAGNFSLEELPKAIALAHQYGAKVHVTCNAFAHDTDLEELPSYIEAIRDAQADAVIVSDLGVLSVVQQVAPELTIHVSTQASVSNAAAAMMWYRLGARRIVCAREMSCEEIAAMRRAIPDDLEIEVFVHGAMCMAISGRCLISDFMTGRAANKGECVQPCRWEYRLKEPSRPDQEFGIEEDEVGTYLMNSKDLNMLSHVQDLRRAGVDSIKIEGRVKKAFYVATVVNAYRHVLDGEDPVLWEKELDTISHRPYSTGFFFGPAEQSTDADMYQQLYDWVGEVVCAAPVTTRASLENSSACSNEAPQDAPLNEEEQTGESAQGMWRVWAKCRNRFYQGDKLEVLSPHEPIREIEVCDLAEVFGYNPDTQSAEELLEMQQAFHALDEVAGNNNQESSSDAQDSMNAFEQGKDKQAGEQENKAINPYAEVSTDTARKAMGLYVFTCSVPLKSHDILRVKRKDPNRKN